MRVGPAQRPHLAFRTGGGQAAVPAVAAGADALDDRVDPVTVALGVLEPLEDDGDEALADRDAIGVRVEGPAATGGGQRLGLAEAQVGERVLDRVDAAGDGHVRDPGLQVSYGKADRGERRRARRVDREVGATEVEPVGDAARDDVHQQAREAVFGPLRQPVVQPSATSSASSPNSFGRLERTV